MNISQRLSQQCKLSYMCKTYCSSVS